MTLLKLDFDTREKEKVYPLSVTFFSDVKLYRALAFFLHAVGWHLVGQMWSAPGTWTISDKWFHRAVKITRSRHGWHVVIRVRESLDPVTVVAAQACLGSDVKRETFNLARALQKAPAFWKRRANVLYSRKVK